jgi:hypothetical protein
VAGRDEPLGGAAQRGRGRRAVGIEHKNAVASKVEVLCVN